MKQLLDSGSSSVLLNGICSRQFRCRRGVRKGDPISPFLFSLAADLLQSVINDLLRKGLISLPFPSHDLDFPVVQYADDTILVRPADL